MRGFCVMDELSYLQLRAGERLSREQMIRLLESHGYSVSALSNEEIEDMAEEIISDHYGEGEGYDCID